MIMCSKCGNKQMWTTYPAPLCAECSMNCLCEECLEYPATHERYELNLPKHDRKRRCDKCMSEVLHRQLLLMRQLIEDRLEEGK